MVRVTFLEGEDKNTINLSNKIGKLISQLDGGKENGDIILKLFSRYNYYSREEVSERILYFNKRIKYGFQLPEQTTISSRIEDDAKINSRIKNLIYCKYKSIESHIINS